jgi:hypothetical protein
MVAPASRDERRPVTMTPRRDAKVVPELPPVAMRTLSFSVYVTFSVMIFDMGAVIANR